MALAHAALTLVRDCERHAYEIAALLTHMLPGPPYNSGQIHTTMTHLEEQGYVTSRRVASGHREKRLYGITPEGRHEWGRWRARPLPEPHTLRDETIIKTIVVGLDEPHLLRVVLFDYQQRLIQWPERFDESAVDPAACESRADLLHALARLLICLRRQAELQWTERCLEEIKTLTAMPNPAPERPASATRPGAPSPDRTRVPPRRRA